MADLRTGDIVPKRRYVVYTDWLYDAPRVILNACQRKHAAPCPGLLAQLKGIPYYVRMNITLTLDDTLVKKIRKIAVERDTTLTGLIRDYLERVAADDETSGRRRREIDALERSFKRFRLRVGKQTWKREDLYVRS